MASTLCRVFVQENLTSAADRKFLAPVYFGYDYYRGIKYLTPPCLRLNDYIRDKTFLKLASAKDPSGDPDLERSEHGIDMVPAASRLPWPSGIRVCRQTKHWQTSLDATRRYVEAFGQSQFPDIVSRSGKSLEDIAQRELGPGFYDGWARFPLYLFPDGDEQCTRLVAILNVYAFILDDFWEMHTLDKFSGVHQYIVSRLKGKAVSRDGKNAIERLTDDFVTEVNGIDHQRRNNYGAEMLRYLVTYLGRPPPQEKYNQMEDYLLYRYEDAAINTIIACTRFTLNIPADMDSPRLATYLQLVGHQISITNDIGSYQKEKEAYESGEVLYLINAVNVTRKLLNLTSEAAVAMTQALQYQVESQIDEEICSLVEQDTLTAGEWRFVDATISLMTGNLLPSIVMSRYGGEMYKLR